jgi:hypothetical protein
MKRFLKYIISLALTFLSLLVIAQESTEDVISISKPNYAVLLGTDYGKGIESLIGEQQKWEINLGFSIVNKLRLTAEYGYGMLQPTNVIRNGSYQAEGNYFRGGGAYVFTVKPNIYLSVGLMYAFATFSDRGKVNIESEFWNDTNAEFNRTSLNANWFEWFLNTEAQTFRNSESFLKNIYWGSKMRLRFLRTDIVQPDFDILAIPGYGKTLSNIVPSVNLFIKYRIDF